MTAVMAATPGMTRRHRKPEKQETQFDRILQRHDRKGELRAEVLGLHPLVLRDMQRYMTFAEIARRRGFPNNRAFRLALLGKLKDELHQRGWTPQRIERFVIARSARLS